MSTNSFKHWTQPKGVFILNIPIEWQYKVLTVDQETEESPYSFELYENSTGRFQLSCYPLADKGSNENFPIQNNKEKIRWFPSRMDGDGFNEHLFHAQVDDQLLIAKYIYPSANSNDDRISKQLKLVHQTLKTLIVIPSSDRTLASNLYKYDNFNASLGASYDLLTNAVKSNSYIEQVILLANQIDAFLRLSIVLKLQLNNKTDDIEIQYLYQGKSEKAILERKIYELAYEQDIIDEEVFDQLNLLYSARNQVIHRYIISFLKTRDIVRVVHKYKLINEKTRLILQKYENMQANQKLGIYGHNLLRVNEFDDSDFRRAFATINDKHLLDELKREI